MAIIVFDQLRSGPRIVKNPLTALNFQYSVDSATLGHIGAQRPFSIGQNTVLPVVLPVQSQLLVGAGFALSGAQVIDQPLKVVLYLPVLLAGIIQNEGQVIQQVADCFQPDLCPLIILNVGALVRIRPDRRSQHQIHRLSTFRFSPEVHKVRQAAQELHQDT